MIIEEEPYKLSDGKKKKREREKKKEIRTAGVTSSGPELYFVQKETEFLI